MLTKIQIAAAVLLATAAALIILAGLFYAASLMVEAHTHIPEAPEVTDMEVLLEGPEYRAVWNNGMRIDIPVSWVYRTTDTGLIAIGGDADLSVIVKEDPESTHDYWSKNIDKLTADQDTFGWCGKSIMYECKKLSSKKHSMIVNVPLEGRRILFVITAPQEPDSYAVRQFLREHTVF